MGEVADFLYKCTPLILGVCAFFIAPAAERLKRNSNRSVDAVQGQTVDLTDYRVQALENDLRQEREIARLQALLIRAGIDYEEKTDDNNGNPAAGAGAER